MELTSRQRLLTFAVIVLAVAGIGAYLFVSGTAKHNPSATSSHRPTPPPTTSAPPTQATTPSPSSSGSTAASSQVNIYNWLPFSQQQLSQAATVVQEFSAYYGTYSYNESTASYIDRMQPLATGQLVKLIQGAYTAPGVASLRSQEKQVSAGSAVINSLRAFGSSSITFVVTVKQRITDNHGPTQQNNQYAVTVANSGAGWQVNNIELASLGNT